MRSLPVRSPHAVNGVLLVALIGGSLGVYPSLPEEIPHHFDLYGVADAYWSTTLLRWMLLPLVALLPAALLYGSAWMVGAFPVSSVNVSSQAQYDALSREKKRFVLRLVQRALYWMTAAALSIFLAVQAGAYVVATSAATALPVATMGAVIAGLLAVLGIVAWLVWGLPRWIRVLSESDGSVGGRADSASSAC